MVGAAAKKRKRKKVHYDPHFESYPSKSHGPQLLNQDWKFCFELSVLIYELLPGLL